MTRIISLIAVTLFAVVALSTSAVAKDFYVVPTSDAAHGDTLLKHSDRLIAKDDAGKASYGKYLDGTRIVVGSLSEALGNCKAGRGDVIHIPADVSISMGVSDSITVSKAGVKIVGDGDYPAVITPGTAFPATNAVIRIAANGVVLENLMIGAPTAVDSVEAAITVGGVDQVMIKDCSIKAVDGRLGKYSYDDLIAIEASSDDLVIKNVAMINDSTLADAMVTLTSAIDLQGASTNVRIEGCSYFGGVGTAGIMDDAQITSLSLINNIISVSGTSAGGTTPGITLDSDPIGIASGNRVGGTATTIANNAAYGTAMRQFDNYVLDEDHATNQATNVIPALTTE